MATKRTYGEACAAAHALDLVGERWALLVIRELVLGPKRFTDLRAGIPFASPNVLSERLRELERAGVVRRRKLAPPAGSRVYELTEWGAELEPVLMDLGRWGARSPLRPDDAPLSVDSLALAMQAMFHPEAAGDLVAAYELRIGEQRFAVRVGAGEIDVARGEPEAADAVIEAEVPALAMLYWAGRDPDEAIAAGELRIEGDRALAERLFGLFGLPEPALVP